MIASNTLQRNLIIFVHNDSLLIRQLEGQDRDDLVKRQHELQESLKNWAILRDCYHDALQSTKRNLEDVDLSADRKITLEANKTKQLEDLLRAAEEFRLVTNQLEKVNENLAQTQPSKRRRTDSGIFSFELHRRNISLIKLDPSSPTSTTSTDSESIVNGYTNVDKAGNISKPGAIWEIDDFTCQACDSQDALNTCHLVAKGGVIDVSTN